MKKAVSILIILSMLLCAGINAEEPFSPIGMVFSGIHAPYILEGGLPSDTDFFTDGDIRSSRLTVINVWDSGCVTCFTELPELEAVYEAYNPRGVSFFGAACRWIGGTYEMAYVYAQQYGVTYPIVIMDDAIALIAQQNGRHTPQTFIVDNMGTVVAYFDGAVTFYTLSSEIDSLLETPGDVNSDGSVDSSDALLVLRYSLGIIAPSALELSLADMDANGVVNSADALIILRLALGVV